MVYAKTIRQLTLVVIDNSDSLSSCSMKTENRNTGLLGPIICNLRSSTIIMQTLRYVVEHVVNYYCLQYFNRVTHAAFFFRYSVPRDQRP